MTTLICNIPTPPKPPLCRIVIEGTIGSCPVCHSTEARRFFPKSLIQFGRKIGCINPECENYYLKVLETDVGTKDAYDNYYNNR